MENSLVLSNGINENISVIERERDILKYSSLNLEEMEDKTKLYNALQKCDILLNDIKGQKINVTGVYIEKKKKAEIDELTGEIIHNKETGEVTLKDAYRTILFDDEGKTYVTSSFGVFNSISQIIQIFGNPTKDNIIHVIVDEKETKNNKRKSLILRVNHDE